MSNKAAMMAGMATGTAAACRTLPSMDRELSWLTGSRLSHGNAMPDRAVLIEAQIPGLRRFARVLLRGDRDAADDFVQDTLEHVLARWHLWRAEGNLRGWLYTILYTRFLTNQHRLRGHGQHDALTEDPELPRVDGGQSSALAHQDSLRAFSALPEEQRSVVFLVGIENLSYDETARVLNVPIGTVMSRLSSARERLRRHIYGEVDKGGARRSSALWTVK